MLLFLLLLEFLVVVATMATMEATMRRVVKREMRSFFLLPEFEIPARDCFILFMIGLKENVLKRRRWRRRRERCGEERKGKDKLFILFDLE